MYEHWINLLICLLVKKFFLIYQNVQNVQFTDSNAVIYIIYIYFKSINS